jgi:lipoate-protein ligase A
MHFVTMRRALSTAAAAAAQKSKLHWLDLRSASLSVLERLLLEECLLKSDDRTRNWMVIGHHHASPHRYLSFSLASSHNHNNDKPCIVMGIGGKPELLLELNKVRRDEIAVIKRFTGGGTVVVDSDCLWTSIIGRNRKEKDTVSSSSTATASTTIEDVEAFPRPIMDWTARAVFGPLFRKLNRQHPSGSPAFELLENDYTLALQSTAENDDHHHLHRKMGGNAQAIVREGWLHHTSFLWTYSQSMGYLKLPQKRPDYRADREHSDFLVQLQQVYPDLNKDGFYESLRQVCDEQFHLVEADWNEILRHVEKQGGMDTIYKNSRTRMLKDL